MKPEDIKKENIYKVPDGYFEQLPTKIMTRIRDEKPNWFLSLDWKPAAKFVFPVAAVLLMVLYFGAPQQNDSYTDAEQILAQVSSEDVLAYLELTDISTDEILEETEIDELYVDFELTEPIPEISDFNENEINELFDEYGIDGELL